LAVALILAAAVGLHLGALGSPFFADDFLFLDQVRFRSLTVVFASPDPIGNFFRPVSRQLWFWCWAGPTHESATAFHVANLGLFLAILVLFFTLIRRFLGVRAALVGAALLAVHHAADVPLLWACGSQDLLAVAGALAAVLLFVDDRRWAAALALGAALLSKETVVATPLVATLLARREREPWTRTWRRAWPMFAVLAAWAGAWIVTVGRRPSMAHEIHSGGWALPAALAHLLQAAVGLEWPRLWGSGLVVPPPALILAAVALITASGAEDSTAPGAEDSTAPGRAREPGVAGSGRARAALRGGVAWALLGALPVAVVADNWSAYYYLFALCGVALAVAAWAASRPAWVGLVLVLALGWTSHQTRSLEEFATAPGAWTLESHVNRHYLERGMSMARSFLEQLRESRPQVPHRSTLFFAGMPIQVAFQTADGPLIRWAYRDTSLRSYFFGQFRMASAERGPVFFFRVTNGRLNELVGRDSLERIGDGLLLSEELVASRDVHILAVRAIPAQFSLRYRLAWIQGALGDSAAMRLGLKACALPLTAGPTPEIAAAREMVARGDTAGARSLVWQGVLRHPLDPAAHSYLAQLDVTRDDLLESCAVEAFAARVLAPEDAIAWRCWGIVQAVKGRPGLAQAALERYLALGGEAARADTQVARFLAEVRRRLPGGDVAQRDVRRMQPGAR
jgi:hypothetical protein